MTKPVCLAINQTAWIRGIESNGAICWRWTLLLENLECECEKFPFLCYLIAVTVLVAHPLKNNR